MDGRARRTQKIILHIQETALDMFSTRGVDQVSMDEIAAAAAVSKVTIYKYFRSKEELHAAAVDLYADRVLADAEKILESGMDFLEIVKLSLLAQVNKPAMASNRYLVDLMNRDAQAGARLKARLKQVLFRFFEEGRRQGYIAEDLPFELLYLHAQIYQSGFEAHLEEIEAALADKESLEKLLNLYFLGIIQRK